MLLPVRLTTAVQHLRLVEALLDGDLDEALAQFVSAWASFRGLDLSLQEVRACRCPCRWPARELAPA